MLNFNEMIEELEKRTKLSEKKLREKIETKQEELSGLVSLEGAAHLVARELGIDLLKIPSRPIKIKNLVTGMKNINLKARVIDITDVREFEKKDGSKGKVSNLIITDETGEIRIPLWDKQVDTIGDNLRVGNVVEIKNANTRQNNFGGIELVLLKDSKLEKIPDDSSIPDKPVEKISKSFDRIYLKTAREGHFEVRGNILDIFNINPIFMMCPECRTKVEKTDDGYKCQNHNIVEPEKSLIITGILDDGTANIRAVFFRDNAKHLTSLDIKSFEGLSQEESIDLIKEKILGNEYVIKGRIQRNKFFDSLEIIADSIEEIDVNIESKALISEIENLKWYE